MKHFNITFKPDGRKISIHAGATLLEAAAQVGIILNSVCGGKGTCKKCLVNLEPDGKEVLACQHQIQSDLVVTIPTSSRFFEQKILSEGIDTNPKFPPDIYEQYLDVEPAGQIFGIAIDVGTTTVVAKLIDMKTGGCLATQVAFNPQFKYGDDVISRIAYAENDTKLAELHKVIVDCINKLIKQLCAQVSIKPEHIYQASVVGNTTMNHIFLKLPVTQLGRAPYEAFTIDAKDTTPEQLALQINPAGNIHTPANIAGFVGSDTTAVALAVEIDSVEQTTLVVDIGTNGELVLAANDKFYAASCAAGPAFEGARISCGSRAVDGAIEAVIINGNDIDIDVIGDSPPHSICGSGLIDAIAVLLDLGIIDPTGKFTKPEKLSPAILSRIIEQDGKLVFVLADSTEGKVILTQKDIRQVQLAKAAIRAGIKLLQKKLGLTDCDIKQILLAGAFGNYIRRESALRIGLLPDVPVECIRFVGNAASSGAQMVLLSQQWREKACQLAKNIQYVEIAHEAEFSDIYTDCMLF
ncbi:MAG: DUF4445 domain-containing protein [Planctomycetes bacterium]|nr:DUF4445 domain-containing protein [Planctomycetota bacterium]